MKKLFYLLFLFPFTVFAQWTWVNPLPQGNDLLDFYLFNSDSLYAVGTAGTVMSLGNSHTNWDIQHQIIPMTPLVRVEFSSPNDGYLLSEYGGFYRSTNGGLSWNYSSTIHYYAYCIKFINETTGFVGADAIYKTTNKGANWVKKLQEYVTSIDFINDTLGFALSFLGSIYKTTDAGENWYLLNALPSQWYTEFDFINEQFGVVVGYDGAIYKTYDGGVHWNYHTINTNRVVTSVYCRDENNFIAVADSGLIIKTTNGGARWILNNKESIVRLRKIGGIGDKLYIIGSYGEILFSDDFGENWSKIGNEITRDSLNYMTNIDPGILWVAGNNGTILNSTDYGQNWIVKNLETSENFYSVDFVDPQKGWIVGSNGLVMTTNDFGETWNQQTFPSTSRLRSVDFYDYNYGFIVGDDGVIYKTTDGGSTWINLSIGNYQFSKIYIKDSMTVWIANLQRQLLRSLDGGNNFNLIATLNSEVYDILFINDQKGFVGCKGGVYKTTNSGETWSPKSGVDTRKLYFVNDNFGWGVGDKGRIIRTINSGDRWDTFGGPNFFEKATDNLLTGVYFKNIEEGIAIGVGGTIIKTENASPTPVELSFFNALVNGYKVELKWQTASELNNQGFEVQRMFGNSDWITIGFKQGLGTTTEITNYSFEDDLSGFNVERVSYRLQQIDFNGTYKFSEVVGILMPPNKYELTQNYPNPFNPATTIRYSITTPSKVKLQIFNALGEEIVSLVNKEQSAGTYEVIWDGKDKYDNAVSSGIYFYRINAGQFSETRKMILLR